MLATHSGGKFGEFTEVRYTMIHGFMDSLCSEPQCQGSGGRARVGSPLPPPAGAPVTAAGLELMGCLKI